MIIDDDYDAPMQEVPLDDQFAVEWLERLARNLPADVELGVPQSAIFDPGPYCVRFETTAATFYSFNASAQRLVRLGAGDDELTEFTSWCGGRETQRTVRRSSDLDAATA